MIVHSPYEAEQGTEAWLKLRMGKVTASELGNLITDTGSLRKRDAGMRMTYIYGKCAEAFRGQALPGFSSFVTEQGIELELQARATLSDILKSEIAHVGFVEREDMPLGCSPDGVIYDGAGFMLTGCEIKCPQPVNACRWAVESKLDANDFGAPPAEHALQVQCSMLVCEVPFWIFYSHSQSLPCVAMKVRPDFELHATIQKAAALFKEDFDECMEKLNSLRAREL
jgi:hypothetical protein